MKQFTREKFLSSTNFTDVAFGCSASGDTFSPTCRNVRNFQAYFECREHGLFLGWRHNDVWCYCSSLAAGQKFKVADLKPPGRQR